MGTQTFIRKLTTTVTGGALIMAATSIVSRLLGLLRDRLLASTFGGGGALDPYFAAFKVPDIIFNILVLGALSSSFIPVFVAYIKKDDSVARDEAWRIANSILNILLIVLVILGILFYIFTPQIIAIVAPGFPGEKQDITIQLSRIMLVAIIFFGISNVVSGILNAFKRFTSFALAPVLYNLGIIFGIIVLTPRYGLMGLAYGVVVGAFLHLAIQIPSVIRVGFRYRRIIDLKHPGVRKIGSLMIPRTIGLAVNQVDLLVNTIIASTLVAGSITVYNFANNLQNFPINVFGVSLAIAAFPVLSEAFAENDKGKFVNQISETVRRILYLMIPISILFLLLRAQIVRVVLGANAYSWEATYLTAQMLGIFALSLFSQSLIPTLARSFYAHHDTKTPVKIAIISVFVDILLALYLSNKYGVLGLAGAYSIANMLNMFLLYYFLRRKFGSLDDTRIVRSGIKIVIASILMGVIVVGMKYFLALGVNMRTFVGIFIQGIVAGTVGLVSYFFLTLFLRCEEVVMIRDWIMRIWNKIRNGKTPTRRESNTQSTNEHH